MAMRLLVLLSALIAVLLIFFFVARPWYLQWGATDEETTMVLPGDEIVPNAGDGETRAITIDAPINHVWPWMAQVGQDRGGFYSFDLLENLVGCQMPTEDRLRPDKQSWALGDKLWMYPREKAGGIGYATLRSFVPGRALGFGTHVVGTSIDQPEDGSWSFVLVPVSDSATRLLIRGRGAPGRTLLGVAFDRAIFEPLHFMMEKRMMIGVKELAETGERGRLVNHVHVAIWALTFVLMIASGLLVLRRTEWQRPLIGFIASAVAFQIMTFVQPHVLIEAAIVVSIVLWVWRGHHRPALREDFM